MATQYFRITAYHPTENISAIMDSFGKFDKLWKFSSFLLTKGFKIIEVATNEKFLDGDLPCVEEDTEHIILRACGKGQPIIQNGIIKVNGKRYIPDKKANK